MEVKEFVKQILVEVAAAADEASTGEDRFSLETAKEGGISFDIAVVKSESSESGGGLQAGLGIKIASVKVGDSQKITAGSENISRIKFTISHYKENSKSGSVKSYSQ